MKQQRTAWVECARPITATAAGGCSGRPACSVICLPLSLQALSDPVANTKKCLDKLLNTAFVHVIDAPSLALIMPVIEVQPWSRCQDRVWPPNHGLAWVSVRLKTAQPRARNEPLPLSATFIA